MRRLARIAAIVPAAAAILAAGTGTAHAASSHTSLWWDTATCRAFGAGHLPVMVADSRHADTYLRVDVALWAHDTHRHASTAIQKRDRSYVAWDCDPRSGYGL